MTRKRWRLFGWLLVLGAIVVLTVWHLVQPERLGAWLVAQAAARGGLQITTRTPASLHLRDGLQLRMQGLDVRMPGAETAIVQAEEFALRLQWSVLWGESRVRGLELWQPVLNQSALDAWIAATQVAPGPATSTPDLALAELQALRIRNGSWQFADRRIEHIDIDLDGFVHGGTSVLDARIELPRDAEAMVLDLHFEGSRTDLSHGIAWPNWRAVIEMDGIELLQSEGSARLMPADDAALDAELRLLNWPERSLGPKPDWIEPFLGSGMRLAWPGWDPARPLLELSSQAAGHSFDAALAPDEIGQWWSRNAWWQVPPLRLQARIDRLDIEGIELHGISIDTETDASQDVRAAEGEPNAH